MHEVHLTDLGSADASEHERQAPYSNVGQVSDSSDLECDALRSNSIPSLFIRTSVT